MKRTEKKDKSLNGKIADLMPVSNSIDEKKVFPLGIVLKALSVSKRLYEKELIRELSSEEKMGLIKAQRILEDKRSDYYREIILEARREFYLSIRNEYSENENENENDSECENTIEEDPFAFASRDTISTPPPLSLVASNPSDDRAISQLWLATLAYASETPLPQNFRPPILAVSFNIVQEFEQLFPDIIADEAIIILQQGHLEASILGDGLSICHKMKANENEIAVLKLRNHSVENLCWLPALNINCISADAQGFVFFTSSKGVPYALISNQKRVHFNLVPLQHSQTKLFFKAYRRNPTSLLSCYQVKRDGSLDESIFRKKLEHPHATAARLKNFSLWEYFANKEDYSPFSPDIRILNMNSADGMDIAITRHPGIEYLIPISGGFHAHIGIPDEIGTLREAEHGLPEVILSPSERKIYGDKRAMFDLNMQSGDQRALASQIVRIDSAARFHGFSAMGQFARAIFVGIQENKASSDWKEFYYASEFAKGAG